MSENILQWENLSVTTKSSKRIILDNLNGEVKSKQTLAIMGSSGAGKTTFLNYLSKRSGTLNLIKTLGDIKLVVNNINESRSITKLSAFVTQDDILFEQLTVDELLTFASEIKLVKKSKEERKIIVDNLINRLGLEKCRNTRVGDVMFKGLSGGEKKRASIGYELITDPKILYLDEPTTGLDVKSAYNVIELITEEAKINNRIVIFTIHQPSSDLFKLFDNLLLLAQGKTVFLGKASDSIKFFNELNYLCPKNFNPAEYLLKILSKEVKDTNTEILNMSSNNQLETEKILQEENESEDIYNQRIILFAESANSKIKLTDISNININRDDMILQTHNPFKQFTILSRRNNILLRRNMMALATRVFFSIVNALLAFIIYPNLGTGDNAVLDRKGALFFISNFVVQSALQMNFMVFIQEKPKFYKEQENGLYSVVPYFFSKIIIEIPLQFIISVVNFLFLYFILGLNDHDVSKYFIYILTIFLAGLSASSMGIFISALIENVNLVAVVFPILLYTQMISSGFFISQDDIPYVFYVFKYMSVFRYTWQALCWNEFTDIGDLECHNPKKCQFPTLNFGESLYWSIFALCIIVIINFIITITTLKIKVWKRKSK